MRCQCSARQWGWCGKGSRQCGWWMPAHWLNVHHRQGGATQDMRPMRSSLQADACCFCVCLLPSSASACCLPLPTCVND
jgi:hypothetical protein